MAKTKQEFENTARPLAEKLIDYAMQKGGKFGITDARVAIACSAEQENSIENGAVVESVAGTSWTVSVTLYAGNRNLNFQSNSLDAATLCKAIDQNMQVIHLVPENADQNLLDSDKVYKGKLADLDLHDNAPPTQEALIDYARKMEAAAFAEPGIKTARQSGISQNNAYSLVLATNGLDHVSANTFYQASISAIAEDASGMEIDYDYSMARHFNDMADPEKVGRQAAQNATAKLSSSLPDSKAASIVLSPDAASTFFGSVMQALDGTSVHRGATFMKDKIGQQVMNKAITLEDDPLVKRGVRSMTLDGAGMKAEKVTFIKDGVLQCFNASLEEARKLGIAPTGRNNGPTNLRVLPGTKSKEALMADIKDGFYIKGFQGGSADVNNGNFSRQAYGNVIKDGKIVGEAVSGFVVSGNLKDMFMNVTVANDTPDLPNPRHMSAMPTMRINGIKIAGK